MQQGLYILMVMLLFAACKSDKQTNEPTSAAQQPEATNIVSLTPAQFKNAGIVTGAITQNAISATLKVTGKIDVPPQNMVSISVPMGGYLKNTQLLPGMHINKGDIIAVVEDQQYIQLQQDYLTAKARIGYYEKDYQRQKDLNKEQASSDKVLQQAEADYNTQKILIGALAQKLQLIGINPNRLTDQNISKSINIYSPIKGYVSKVNVNIGKYVSPTEVLFELIDPEDIHLSLSIFEKDVNKLYVGQIVTAFTNNDPTKKHRCEIILIGKDVNNDRTVNVHCHFDAYDKLLIPGTYMNAEITLKENAANVLPEEAIVRFENGTYIFAATGERTFTMIAVKTGQTENGFTEILPDGNPLPEKVVVKGSYNLLMSLKNTGE